MVLYKFQKQSQKTKNQQKIQKWLEVGLYFIYKAQNLHAMIFFDFKASDTASRVDYR